MSVVHQLRPLSSLPHEPRVGIRRRGVSIVGAFLPLEIGFFVLAPGPRSRRILIVLALEALLARPSFDERPVHSEVLARQ